MANKFNSVIKRLDWKKIIGALLLITLLFSILYSIVKIVNAPHEGEGLDESVRVKSDYTLMLIQCVLGLIVMAIPSLIEKKVDDQHTKLYVCALILYFYTAAIYLGEVRNFYFIPHWDTILHAFSGAMLGALGFSLCILNGSKRLRLKLSPFYSLVCILFCPCGR